MTTFLDKLKRIFLNKSLRNKILFVLGVLVVYRFLSHVPVPGIPTDKLAAFFNSNQLLNLISVFSGSGLSSLSIIMLGVGPYITASIIIQLMTMIFPKLKEMQQEGGAEGRRKFTQYSRMLTVPLAIIQAFSYIILLQRSGVIPSNIPAFQMMTNVSIIVAGSILVMWLGELATEFGIGNGISTIIFAGIVSRLPQMIAQVQSSILDSSQLPAVIGAVVLALVVIYFVVVVTEAERPIPVTYTKQMRGASSQGGSGVATYLPLRLNQAGVIPIIFAISILVFPQMLLSLVKNSKYAWINTTAAGVDAFMQNTWFYAGAYFVLVVLFTFFYTSVTFDPKSISENLQKNGAFISGIRPGESTMQYLSHVVTRITLVGAVFLGLIAVLPVIVHAITGIQALTIGGTALLIVVSVVMDMIKKVSAQLSMEEY
ncbi:MAG: preprotein translocase subunit SecY [bacterium]